MDKFPKNFLNHFKSLVPTLMEMQRLVLELKDMDSDLHEYVNSKAITHLYEQAQNVELAQLNLIQSLVTKEFFDPKDYDGNRRTWTDKQNQFVDDLKQQILDAVLESDEPELAEQLFK